MKPAWGARVFARISRVPPFAAAIVAMTLGVLMCLLSFPLGLASVACPSGKQAGFIYEVNWVLNFVFVLPAAFYLAGLTVSSIGAAIRNMAASRMLVDGQGKALSPDEAVASWHAVVGRIVPLCILLVLAAFGEGIGEWYSHGYLPISHHSTSGLDPEYACTWSIAHLLQPQQVSAAVNHLFALPMYLGQGVAASFYLSLVAIVLAFAYWLDRFNRRSDLPDLVPSIASTDRRLGFELLEPFIQNLFLSALGYAAALFLIRIQFLFLGSSSKAASVYAFVLDDVAAGFFRGAKALFEGDTRLFDAGQRMVFSTAGAIIAFLILLVISFLIVSTVLRQAAVRARDVFLLKRDELAPLYPSVAPAEQERRLRTMVFWPLSYPGPLNLLFIMSFSVAAFVAYKLTLIVIGIVVAFGGRRFYAILSGKEDGGPASPAPPSPQEQPAGQ